MNTLTPESRYGSIEEVAAVLAVNPRTVRRLIATGHLTGYRVGSRIIRVNLDEVQNLLQPIPAARAGRSA